MLATYSTSIFESIGILSSFSFTKTETVWEDYETFAIPKIKESTIKLRGFLYYLKDTSPKEANKALKSIIPMLPILTLLKNTLDQIKDKEFNNFKKVAFDFFATVEFLCLSLQDVADINSSYKLSHPVLQTDWDKEADNHWDNY